MLMESEFNGVSAGRWAAWHAVYTRHQHEKTVANVLAGKQFEVFLPLYEANRRWKDRIARISLPLFPGYVFLRGDLERRLAILTTPGVHCLLSMGGRPAAIPDAEIEAVRRAVEARLQSEPCPFLRCGDRVRVTSGPLAGIEGIVARKKNSCRLVLSVELLEKSIAVEVDGTALERISSQPNRMHSNWKQPAFGVVPASA
jgi:transcription antitermination factor NusG